MVPNMRKFVPTLKKLSMLLSVFLSASNIAQETGPFNLGSTVNSAARDAEPTFTPDGNTMYFNCFDRGERIGSDICVTHRQEADWSEPQIVWEVSTPDYLEVEPLLSPDAQQLYIMSDRPGGFGSTDIYVSNWLEDKWSEPRNLGKPFNSPYMDHCLYFSGEKWEFAYWTSTRPGGLGGNDIWMSEKVNEIWQEATNLGPKVNSAAHEHHSLPSEDGKSLYITTTREEGFGMEDIYVTTKNNNGEWTALTNLGPDVNSDQDDRCPAFSPDFEYFYFDSERLDGFGNKDIWYIPYSLIKDIR
ncbi:MAG: hypothetical protein CMQ41_12950 [Gammaproteobacteria bacterium]|nr:hypothetical protein [Gammaproteobacteria bacterium]|tara:strand:+ start:1463 stop:2365 length:903 start_codon:yes stop_codon:yes gene_type:complete